MNIKRTLTIALITLTIAAAVSAQEGTRGTYYTLYGQNHLSSWQSFRLAVDNPRYSDSEIIPCIRVTWIATFFELPGDGSVSPSPLRRVRREIELDPGEAASWDIPAAMACDGSVCPQIRNGVSVAVSVFATPVEGEPIPRQLNFTSTLAMREFSRTIFTLPAVQKGFDPQPDPPAMQQ